MAAPVKLNFKVYQGSTFREVFRWESSTKNYVPITAISKTAPVVVTAPSHNMPVGWRGRITGVLGMKEINDADNYRTATATTTDTVTFNAVNATGYTAYTSGGILEYNAPIDLLNYNGRMQIRPTLTSSTIIQELTVANGGIVINNTAKTITVLMTAEQTQTFTFGTAVYSLEIYNSFEVVPFCTGTLTLVQEVTR